MKLGACSGGTLYGVLTPVTRESVSSGASAPSRADWNAGSETTSVVLPKMRVKLDLVDAFWGWTSSLINCAATPAGSLAPKPPLVTSVPPVRIPTTERPKSSAETTRVAQRQRYTKRPQRSNIEPTRYKARDCRLPAPRAQRSAIGAST